MKLAERTRELMEELLANGTLEQWQIVAIETAMADAHHLGLAAVPVANTPAQLNVTVEQATEAILEACKDYPMLRVTTRLRVSDIVSEVALRAMNTGIEANAILD